MLDPDPDNANKGNQNENADVVSVARRRAMKVGLASVPLILTLRSKRLFAQTTDTTTTASTGLSANSAAGIEQHADIKTA